MGNPHLTAKQKSDCFAPLPPDQEIPQVSQAWLELSLSPFYGGDPHSAAFEPRPVGASIFQAEGQGGALRGISQFFSRAP